MNRDQAKALLKAADALPAALGAGCTFRNRKPYCAVGHMAAALGVTAPEGDRELLIYGHHQVDQAYDCDADAIEVANDTSGPQRRRARVIAEVEKQVRSAGYDPSALRAEASA